MNMYVGARVYCNSIGYYHTMHGARRRLYQIGDTGTIVRIEENGFEDGYMALVHWDIERHPGSAFGQGNWWICLQGVDLTHPITDDQEAAMKLMIKELSDA